MSKRGPNESESPRRKVFALRIFGLAVVGSGLFRFLSREGGVNGLWFGLVMGGLALAGAHFLARGRSGIGLPLAWCALVFVAGWFGYEALVQKGIAAAEVRQLLILLTALATIVVLALPSKRKS